MEGVEAARWSDVGWDSDIEDFIVKSDVVGGNFNGRVACGEGVDESACLALAVNLRVKMLESERTLRIEEVRPQGVGGRRR
jgi:hypothetical protein